MPTSIVVYVQRWINNQVTTQETLWAEASLIIGGYNWRWVPVDLSRAASGVPSGYTFLYRFKQWAKSTLSSGAWQKGVDSDNTGWYFDQSNGAQRQRIFANELYYPDSGEDYLKKENVQAYWNETWYHEFEIINLTGKTYTLGYNGNSSNGGSTANTSAVYPNNLYIASNGFTRTGYSFTGWATSSTGAIAYNQNTNISHPGTDSSATLYAVWEANTYTIRYNANSGSGTVSGSTSNTSAVYNNRLTIRSNGFTRTGYSFTGWATSSTGGVSQDYIVGTTINHPGSNLTLDLYAVWEANTYTIRYNANSGNDIVSGSTSNTSEVYNNSLTIRSNGFTRTGFYFDGWATTANGGVSQDYIVGTTINHPGSNLTLDLYAVWIAMYNITFNNSGRGESISTVLSGTSGTVINIFPILGNTIGYIFSGWMINNVLITSITLTGNVILYAKWDVDASVSFSYIQEIFGGNYPIYLSEYYLNNTLVFSPGGIDIPISGQISLSKFYNKYKSPYIPISILNGDKAANMNEDNARSMFGGGSSDDGNSSITVGFKFYWFGTEFGLNNNIQWNANNVLTFGGANVSQYNAWGAATGSGVLMGQSDRYVKIAKQFDPYINTGFNVKRFIVKSYNYYSDYFIDPQPDPPIEMEIILMRGPTRQFINIRLNKWTATTPGIWQISNGTNFYDVLSGITTRLTAGSSIGLAGTLTGTDWVAGNQHIILPSSAIDMLINGVNLLLYLDGYSIDGILNYTLTSYIQKWVNLANSDLIVTQDNNNNQPMYIGGIYGAVFQQGKSLVSDINLHSYPELNIFVVLKKTSIVNNVAKYIWTVSSEGSRAATGGFISVVGSYGRGLFYVDNDSDGNSYIGLNVGIDRTYYFNYKFPLSSNVVLNCEYNSNGNLGKFSINGEYVDFYNGAPIINTQIKLYIGANSATGGTDSFLGTIHEFIVINRLLTDTERRNIYNLLYTKWNVDVFDAIRGMGANLILRHDAKNVNGDTNLAITNGSTISKWYNSATSLLPLGPVGSLIVTQQITESAKPTYTNNSVVFTTGKGIVSTMQINSYPMLNIFVVWKYKEFPTGSNIHTLWNDYSLFRAIRIHPGNIIRVYIGHPNENNPNEREYGILNNPFINTNTMLIYNVEYNFPGFPGKFFINNTNYMDFTSKYTNDISGTSLLTAFGCSLLLTNGYNSIIGDIYEIIVINRLLTTTERTKIYNLLKTKWNVP